MTTFGSTIESLRREANLGIRELCRLQEKSGTVHDPMSPAYLSRLEKR